MHSTYLKTTAALALACSTALVFAVTTVQARPGSGNDHDHDRVFVQDRDHRRPLEHSHCGRKHRG